MDKTQFDFGISSACFYPLETEKSLEVAGELGFKNVELFINSPSELSDEYVGKFLSIADKYKIKIVSVHPFFSFAESFFLFSDYERRFWDILPLYDRFFKVTNMLKADIFVIHGAKKTSKINFEVYCERYKKLMSMASRYGVKVLHENVVDHRSGDPCYLKKMKDEIGADFKITLDIKQARRAGFSPYDFTDLLPKSIDHIHISDFNDSRDCLPPLSGNFDFLNFFKTMKNLGFMGKYIIELYNWSYKSYDEILNSFKKLLKLTENI